MLKPLWNKIKEAIVSVLPVTIIVVLLNYIAPLLKISDSFILSTQELLIFIFCAVLLILGIGLFNLGADISMQPMGEQIGSSLVKNRKIFIIVLVAFVMGLLITIAEPDLTVLAEQVSNAIPSKLLVISVGIGVGLFLLLAIIKIILKKDLSTILIFFYMVMFALIALLILNENTSFLSLALDSGGVTTGPITVPFIMALGVGVATTIGGRNSKENSFGLIALCSIGPIIAVLILGIIFNQEIEISDPNYQVTTNLFKDLFDTLKVTSLEVIIALGLIVVFFFIIQFIYIKLPKRKLLTLAIGIIYTFVGLVIFLTAANIGFLPVGYKIGKTIANISNPSLIIIFGFILGFVVVFAEPAVHVLKKQVEEITNGAVSKKSMLIALSIGVGISICLSMIRIVFDFSILYYVIPGYLISLGLSFFVPKIYTAIAFDSGGVASGPLTSTFILPLAIGACVSITGDASNIMENAFGVVAMVAMTPLITIQLLGFKSIVQSHITQKSRMKKIVDASDEQIINFM